MSIDFNPTSYEDQLAIIRQQQELQRAAIQEQTEQQRDTERTKVTPVTTVETPERKLSPDSPYPDSRKPSLTLEDFSSPITRDSPQANAAAWKLMKNAELAAGGAFFDFITGAKAPVAKGASETKDASPPGGIQLSSLATDLANGARSLANGDSTKAQLAFIGVVGQHLNNDAEKSREFGAILANPSTEKKQMAVDFLLREFHDKPEALKATIRAGLDLKEMGLSEGRKDLFAQFGAEFIGKIPPGQLASVSEFASKMIDQGIDPMTAGADSSKLAQKLEMTTADVAAAQKTIADAGKAWLTSKGFPADKVAGLLDPKHPDSIVDKNGNINTTKLSQFLAQQEADKQSVATTGKTLAQNQEAINAGIAKANAGQAKVNQGWEEIGGFWTAIGAGLIGRTEERNQGIRNAHAGQNEVNAGWAKINEGQRQLNEAIAARDAGAREIKKQLDSALAEAGPNAVRLAQDFFAHSSSAHKPIDTMEITSQTNAESDPNFKFVSTETGEKYAFHKELYEGKPVVYEYKPGQEAKRVEDDNLARTIVAKSKEWQTAIQAQRTPPAGIQDPKHNQYTLNDGSIVALSNEGPLTAYSRYENKDGTGMWKRLSAAEAQSLAARERSFTTGSSPRSGFADPDTRIRIDDLQALGAAAGNLIPEDIRYSREGAGVKVYKGSDKQDLYYQITDSDAFKKANPGYQGTSETNTIAIYENNKWSFVPASDTARLARIKAAMNFANRAKP